MPAHDTISYTHVDDCLAGWTYSCPVWVTQNHGFGMDPSTSSGLVCCKVFVVVFVAIIMLIHVMQST